jgi:4-amino-4-deoxy-L-arabinose transferase-like glycosyltransferase
MTAASILTPFRTLSGTLPQETERSWIVTIFALSFAVKLVLAATLPLGLDESYAIAVARDYDLSFSDHPPISFWAPVAAADLFGIEHRLVYRLPFLVFGVITFWALWAIGCRLGDARTGRLTAILFALAPAPTLIFGFMAVPDGPVGAFSALAVLALLRILQDGPRLSDWLWGGAALGLALASKYQAGLLALTLLGFALLSPAGRLWWRQPGFYAALVLSAAGLLPVLIWNMANEWASFAFHGGRTAPAFQPGNLSRMLLFQVGMLLPPVLYVALRGLIRSRGGATPAVTLVSAIAITQIVVFHLVFAITPQSFAHWTMPGWLFALPLGALWLSRAGEARATRVWRHVLGWGAALWGLAPVVLLHLHFGILTPGSDPSWDDTRGAFPYKPLEEALAARGLLEETDVLIARDWIEGGVVSTALGGAFPVRLLGGDPHHFRFLPGWTATGEALILRPLRLSEAGPVTAELLEQARRYDPDAEVLDPVILTRGGPYLSVAVIRLTLPDGG